MNGKYINIEPSGSGIVIHARGIWRISQISNIIPEIEALVPGHARQIVVDGSAIEEIDTTGALLLFRSIEVSGLDIYSAKFEGLSVDHGNLIQLVQDRYGVPEKKHRLRELNLLQFMGKSSLQIMETVKKIFSFIGETTYANLSVIAKPAKIRLRELFVQLELCCLHAFPVVSLVTFLIGVVIAYLFAIQVEKYGGNIFIVDAVALAMCRELSPVLVAIIVAGRSGSAFTAQIGTMKLNEEVDAMKTLGLSPLHVLVLPRLYALVLAMPLLVFVGDIMGIIGGMLIADIRLGVTGPTFIDRLQVAVSVKSFMVGMIKAPVFAAFIAAIGCRLGLAVEDNARAVGLNTTSTVVQSIVSVILLDAAFAIAFVEFGI